jgi:hypothetical protein
MLMPSFEVGSSSNLIFPYRRLVPSSERSTSSIIQSSYFLFTKSQAKKFDTLGLLRDLYRTSNF